MEQNFKSKQSLTKEQALQKLRHYCAYAERCHNDVISKLYDLNVWKKDHDEIVATLIEENYLNEERFAKLFAGGHFRTKQWGKNKIIQGLKQKGISAYCIKAGLKEIDEADYEATLQKLFQQKWESVKGTQNRFAKMKKVSDYLLQKGYEAQLINQLFNKI
ncbi:regulatory protein RecX [Niabella ginsengisoli]|uniref:Regulatory protein RecX n=1 Tax=Niabella ginsengisoli TaxID=522298 RepID=A0ABS9SNP0_9BACT|nr:regulatory protein RecX [Niabella ginsengisoli]MCH5600008.1 RecX family transcriptional regulator [Niabella ginsengisoli]